MTDGRGPVGVVGAGTMGAGIAQVALEAGHPVRLFDVAPDAVVGGRARIRSGLQRRARKLGLDKATTLAWVEDRLARLGAPASIEALADGVDLVIEAAVEDLAAKQALFRTLDAVAPRAALLATNTSALSIGRIASAVARTERVLGLHFFNPAPVMGLVEVVAAAGTEPAVVERASRLMLDWGKVPIRVADSPGFVVNRVNRPFTLEALAIVEDRQATTEQIDAAIREAGFPMGPFALMDLVGIDVNLAAARGVYDGFGGDDDPTAARFRPSAIQRSLAAAGRLGRKTGAGFYRYDTEGRIGGPDPAFVDAVEDPLPAEAIADRIVLAVVNEAYRAVGDQVASKGDVDLALRLGAGWPFGPFEWAERTGVRAVLASLHALAGHHPSPRLVPSAALRAAAEGCC